MLEIYREVSQSLAKSFGEQTQHYKFSSLRYSKCHIFYTIKAIPIMSCA